MDINILFFEILQVAIGNRKELSVIPSENEWHNLYDTANKQALLGICFCGCQKLTKEQWPPKALVLKWNGVSEQIRKTNIKLNRQCLTIQNYIRKAGFETCILKGQGNALMYDSPDYRNSGDIDIWLYKDGASTVEENRRAVIDFAKSKLSKIEARIHHVDFLSIEDTNVEVHYLPMYFYNFIFQRRFEKFCMDNVKEQCENCVDGLYVPKADFNAVYQLVHILRHLFEEGIGLRQLMDYYYVLKTLHDKMPNRKDAVMAEINHLSMGRFVASIMYVMEKVFGMTKEYMLCEPNENSGSILLNEIMMAGNFGKRDERIGKWKNKSIFAMFIWKFFFNLRLWRICPSEIAFGPAFRIWHYTWRKKNGFV